MLIRPGSTAELSAAIKDIRAKAAAQGRPLKMRATRPGFATMHSMPCASQPSNPSPFLVKGKTPMVVGIMTDKMTDVLSVDQGLKQLRVQAQMKLKGLYEAAEANQMSTPRSALPWWQGLTLAGTFSTTSHGSGFNATSMLVCTHSTRIRWSWLHVCQQ
jgi:FAD/FMN-containing dehydrogenase